MPTHPPAPASTTVSWQPLCSPSAYHLCGGITAGLPVSIWMLEDPLSPPPAFESQTPPQPVDPAAPPWLLVVEPWSTVVSSPPWPSSPLALPGSLGLSSTIRRLGTPLLRLRLCQAPPSLRLHLSSRSHLFRLGPPDPLHHPGSSALRLCLGLLLRHWSAPWSRQPFLHHGSSLCRLHRGLPSWLWPAGSSCSKSLRSPPSIWSALAPPWTLFAVLHPGVCPPPEPPPGIPSLPLSCPWTVCVCFSPLVLSVT